MSATLDGARVAGLLGDAPVIESEGRSFPVDIRYRRAARPARRRGRGGQGDPRGAGRRRAAACLPSCRASARSSAPPSGWQAASAPMSISCRSTAMLDGKAQDAAIRPAPAGRRKVVLATSIAETSITIDGVRVVVDSGLSRLPKYEPATGLTRLETVRVSRASADQRAGRAGRTQPGVAIRLWRAEQTAALPAFTPPEILEADLSGLLLDCAAFGVADPASACLPRSAAGAGARRSARAAADARRDRRRRAASPRAAGRCAGSRCRCGWRIWSPRPRQSGAGGRRRHACGADHRARAWRRQRRSRTAAARGLRARTIAARRRPPASLAERLGARRSDGEAPHRLTCRELPQVQPAGAC